MNGDLQPALAEVQRALEIVHTAVSDSSASFPCQCLTCSPERPVVSSAPKPARRKSLKAAALKRYFQNVEEHKAILREHGMVFKDSVSEVSSTLVVGVRRVRSRHCWCRYTLSSAYRIVPRQIASAPTVSLSSCVWFRVLVGRRAGILAELGGGCVDLECGPPFFDMRCWR